MRIFLSFILCFQNIAAGFRDALGRHAVSALSDYAQHRVSTVLLKKQSRPVLIHSSEIGTIEFESKGFSIQGIDKNKPRTT